jgi:hypothetical protein
MNIAKSRSGPAAILAAYMAVAGTASAKDLSQIDFSLRLPAALSKFSPYSDVAAVGGASAGSRSPSSANPAATDWGLTLDHPGVSSEYSAVPFQHGPTLHVIAEALAFKTENWGSLQPGAAQVRSDGPTNGNFLLLSADFGQMQWGYKIKDNFAVGLNLNYTAFDARGGFGGVTSSRSHSDTYDVRGGVLAAISQSLIFGLVTDYSTSPAKTTFSDPGCGCLTGSHDRTTEVLAKPGLSFEYAPLSSVYLDYQYGSYRNSTGSFSTNRVFFGVEHNIFPWLFARAGAAYDFRGILSPTVGIGLNPSERISIDIGFQSDMFPELGPEYGRSKLFSISAGVSF